MVDYMRIARGIDQQSVANTWHQTKISMPYVAGDQRVPMIRQILLDVPLGSGDVPAPVADFVEYATVLTSKEVAAPPGPQDDEYIACFAQLILNGSAAATDTAMVNKHHGDNVRYFDPPIAYPFDEIWLGTNTKNCAGVQWSATMIFYTMEKMAIADILQAREELS